MKLHWRWTYAAPREALWRYVADTDWVNREAGLPPISARFEQGPNRENRRIAWFDFGPLRVEWEERPTRWRAPEYYEVERIYRRGPLLRFSNRTSLEAIDATTTAIVVDIEMQARAGFGAALPLLAANGRRGAKRAFDRAAALVAKAPAATATGRFASLTREGIAAEAVDALERYLGEADERELSRIEPYVVADRYAVDRREMLRALLLATKRGSFNMRWDVLCPSCRGASSSFGSLEHLRAELHCEACNLPYGPSFDRSVEITFDAKPIGRGVDVPLYCVASPLRSPHVLAQTSVGPNGAATLACVLETDRYDVNAIGIAMMPFDARPDGDAQARVAISALGVAVPPIVSSTLEAIPLENALDREVAVRIERATWPNTIATAAHVTALQEFRDLFSSEVLAPGLELAIESMAILFTDIVGSTAMYARAGDAPAFRLVSDHFDRLRAVIVGEGGTIVKTIGDAVMAAFVDPVACFRAARELDAAVRHLVHDGSPLRLRAGFHVGPCIVMRANERIDYFGTTVNLAARLQSHAHAGEVTLARHIAQLPEIGSAIADSGSGTFVERLAIKGFSSEVEVVRVCDT